MSKLSPVTRGSQEIGAAESEPGPVPGARFLSAARLENTNTCRLGYHIPAADPAAGVGDPIALHVVSRKRESADVDPFADITSPDDVKANAEKSLPLDAAALDTDVAVDIENDLDRTAETEESIAVIEWADAV